MKISEELQKRGYEALRPYNSTSIFMNKIGETNNDNVIEIKGKEPAICSQKSEVVTPFNYFDLLKLINNNIYINPYTRETLPLNFIKTRESFLKKILLNFRLQNFNLLENVNNTPLVSTELLLQKKMLHDLWDKLYYPPSISVFINATDDKINNVLERLYLICFFNIMYNTDNIPYPMFTEKIKNDIYRLTGIKKKFEFLKLLTSIINYNDTHQDTRILTVTFLFQNFEIYSLDEDDAEYYW